MLGTKKLINKGGNPREEATQKRNLKRRRWNQKVIKQKGILGKGVQQSIQWKGHLQKGVVHYCKIRREEQKGAQQEGVQGKEQWWLRSYLLLCYFFIEIGV